MTTTAETSHDLHHAPSPPRSRLRRLLLGAGLLRGAWMTLLFAGFGFGLVVVVRWAAHWLITP